MKYYILFVISIIFMGCSPPSEPEDNKEIILGNGSFENNGVFSLDGWAKSMPDSFYTFSNGSVYGGDYSLVVKSSNGAAPYVTYSLSLAEGSADYELTLWTKTSNVFAKAHLAVKRGDSLYYGPQIDIYNTEWQQNKITYNIDAKPGDELKIILKGGSSPNLGGRTYYDDLTLIRR